MTGIEEHQLTPAEEQNCNEFLLMRNYFRRLESPDTDPSAVVELHRIIAKAILDMSEGDWLCKKLKLTEFEIARLKSDRKCHQFLKPDMLSRVRSFVDEYLRETKDL